MVKLKINPFDSAAKSIPFGVKSKGIMSPGLAYFNKTSNLISLRGRKEEYVVF